MSDRTRQQLARIGAPAALLAAVTIAVLLVRSGIDGREQPVGGTTAVATTVETGPVVDPSTPLPTQPTDTTTRPAETEGAEFYAIQSGDTLETVAERYGTSVEALLEMNPGIDPVALTVGQRIRVG